MKGSINGGLNALLEISALVDPHTQGHQSRTAMLVAVAAGALGWPISTIEICVAAAGLHDIGKVGVEPRLLTKPSRLSKHEWAIIREHCEHGRRILRHIKQWPMLSIVANLHHERLDGSGYPHGFRGKVLPPEARLVAICDTVEAMCGLRPYRRTPGISEALSVINDGAGTLYDRHMVKVVSDLFYDGQFTWSERGEK